MILILEIAFFAGGLYALITGKVPSILFGGPRYEVTGTPARVLGLILMLPIPAAFAFGFMIGLLNPTPDAQMQATVFEIVFTLLVAIVAAIFVRMARQPRMVQDAQGNLVAVSPTEEEIARKVNGSIFYLVLGGLGFAGFILGPLAWWRGRQAVRLIDEHHIGEQYRTRARIVSTLGLVIGVFWLLVCGLATWSLAFA